MDEAWNNGRRKLNISIRNNRAQVIKERLRSGNTQHRGYEDVWYGVWDIFINMSITRFESVGLIPQPRIVRRFGADEKESVTWRIPDFGIVRYIEKRLGTARDRRVWFEQESRLVGIMEIKCSPVDNSPLMVLHALNEARIDLVHQVELFFEANPNMDSIIGISVAGDWWSYEMFTRDNLPVIPRKEHDADSYIPSSDSTGSKQLNRSDSDAGEGSDEEYDDESDDDSGQESDNNNSGSDNGPGNGSAEDSDDESNNEDGNVSSNHSDSIGGANPGSHSADESSDKTNDNETSETASSKDELDIISQDEGPIAGGSVPYRRSRSVSGGFENVYQLQTASSNAAIIDLFEAIRDLPSCRDIIEQHF